MPHRLEITLKPGLFDPEGQGIRNKARNYFGIHLDSVRTIQVITIDAALTPDQLIKVQTEIFTNPVTQVSAFTPLDLDFDWTIWVGFRPGVRDNAGSTAVEALEDVLGIRLKPGEAIYTSKRYCIQSKDLTVVQADTLAGELLANDIIQQWRIYPESNWSPIDGIGMMIPRVRLDHSPAVTAIPVDSDRNLEAVSLSRNLALNSNDIPIIRRYFFDPSVRQDRAKWGLSDPTDIELEYLSQARSDHCNHNTFRGLFRYRNLDSGLRQPQRQLPVRSWNRDQRLALSRRHPDGRRHHWHHLQRYAHGKQLHHRQLWHAERHPADHHSAQWLQPH